MLHKHSTPVAVVPSHSSLQFQNDHSVVFKYYLLISNQVQILEGGGAPGMHPLVFLQTGIIAETGHLCVGAQVLPLLSLRSYCTSNQKLACFVLYLKITNTFSKSNICIL